MVRVDAILLCMKKRGIRFFGRIKFPNTDVIRYHTRTEFLAHVRSRENEYDNVLFMAHGAEDSIITPVFRTQKYVRYITEAEADAFKNDFVFAVSCSTAKQFGRKCVEEGAIAYLGYEVQFGNLFSCTNDNNRVFPKHVRKSIDLIVKHIFINALSSAYEEFLRNPISVKVLRERYAFLLEQSIAELSDMTVDELHTRYSVRISEHEFNKYFVYLVSMTLSSLDEILPCLICLGDENYISPTFIKYQIEMGKDSNYLAQELQENASFQMIHNQAFRAYMLSKLQEDRAAAGVAYTLQ